MGDAENALQPSKKRAAGRELTRDTPIDDEEDVPELETGTFKKASDEVLATRRIVKVRRQQSSAAPSSNPFAGIRLVAPTEPSANAAEPRNVKQSVGVSTCAGDSTRSDTIAKDSEEAKDGETEQSESKTDEVEEKSVASKDAVEESNAADEESAAVKPEADREKSEDVNNSENEDKKDAASKESVNEIDTGNDGKKENTDNGDKKDDKVEGAEPRAEGGNLKSFQQLSSTQNAFTGLAGTGFSTSSFSFGTVSKDGSSSIFGTQNDKPFGLGLSNNGSSVFGASGAPSITKSDGSGIAALQEVVVETGEENEKAVFNADSVLFEFVDGGWKERGKGEVKVNITTSGEEKARLLMRSKGNYRLILNARLYPDMKLTNMDKKGVTFACINSATEGKGGLSTFALKFKDGSIVEEFKAAVISHKGGAASALTSTSTVLKTPENSPKASED